MDSEPFNILQDLHNDIWREELLGTMFSKIVQLDLTRQQRQITELKVQLCQDRKSGLTLDEIKEVDKAENRQIAKTMLLKVGTIKRAIYTIKYKFRNDGVDNRVDDKIRKYKFNRGLHVDENGNPI